MAQTLGRARVIGTYRRPQQGWRIREVRRDLPLLAKSRSRSAGTALKLRQQTSPGVQGNPYPKVKTPRIWMSFKTAHIQPTLSPPLEAFGVTTIGVGTFSEVGGGGKSNWVSDCDDAQRNPLLRQNKIGNIDRYCIFSSGTLGSDQLGSGFGLAQPGARFCSVRFGTMGFARLNSKLSCLGSKLGLAWLGDSFGWLGAFFGAPALMGWPQTAVQNLAPWPLLTSIGQTVSSDTECF